MMFLTFAHATSDNLDVVSQYLSAAEYDFQAKEWSLSYFHYYNAEQAMNMKSDDPEDQSIIFRILVGKEICQAFMWQEHDTMQKRLEIIFDQIRPRQTQ